MSNESGIEYLDNGNDTGTCIGRSSASKLAFFGSTPVTRWSGANSAAIAISGGATSGSTIVASIQSAVAAHEVLLNNIVQMLKLYNLSAGA